MEEDRIEEYRHMVDDAEEKQIKIDIMDDGAEDNK